MLPALGIALACPSLAALVTVFYSCLIVFAVAVYRKWFRVPVKVLSSPGPLRQRQSALWRDADISGFSEIPISRTGCGCFCSLISQMEITGWNRREIFSDRAGLVGESAAFAEQAKGLAMSEIMLTGIAGYYGLVAAVLLAAAVVALFLAFLRISLRQRNCLGMLMGCGCTAVLLVQTLVYLAANLGNVRAGERLPLRVGGRHFDICNLYSARNSAEYLQISEYRAGDPEVRGDVPGGAVVLISCMQISAVRSPLAHLPRPG